MNYRYYLGNNVTLQVLLSSNNIFTFYQNNTGTVSSLMGEDTKAVGYFKKAVALGRQTNSEDLSTFLVNLGMTKIKIGQQFNFSTLIIFLIF